jgi:UDP-N-acetylglucosamine/UDP-N-acetylgalactosamine diphosphorylase
MSIPADLRARYEAHGQGHVFRFADAGLLTPAQTAALIDQLAAIDVPLVNALFAATMAAAAAPPAAQALAPPTNVVSQASAPPAERAAWRAEGLAAIAGGRAAALVLAGGQGTRLGFDRPKGEYSLGLPSGRSLFALQAARLQRLRVLAAAAAGAPPGAPLPPLPLYIMTSPMTDADTRAYWEAHAYFGLPRADVMFFSQGTLPCLSGGEGRILLEAGGAVAQAPDGNGGIYRGMHLQGVVADMQRRGVAGVHVFAVDNAIVRAADPEFLGFCLRARADVGSKVCPKAGPHEKVGVLCRVGGAYSVVEYSDMDRATAELRGEDGALVFNAGNLCMHYYSTEFLAGPCSPEQLPKVYHLAKKVCAQCGDLNNEARALPLLSHAPPLARRPITRSFPWRTRPRAPP